MTTTKQNIKKAAYTAIGAPATGARGAKERIRELQDRIQITKESLSQSITSTREAVSENFGNEFDQWVAEGEAVVNRMLDRLRSTGAPSEFRAGRQKTVDQVRQGMKDVSDRIDSVLDVIEPELDLRLIRGVGPAGATQMIDAGIPGIAGFLSRTESEEMIDELAGELSIPRDTIVEWRNQVDLTQIKGIGETNQRMLHALGIGTVEQLANEDGTSLHGKFEQLDQPGMPRQIPSGSTIGEWIRDANRLSQLSESPNKEGKK